MRRFIPAKLLWWIKKIRPGYCWSDLVLWKLGGYDVEFGAPVGLCDEEVVKYGHGYCGYCTRENRGLK